MDAERPINGYCEATKYLDTRLFIYLLMYVSQMHGYLELKNVINSDLLPQLY